MFGKSGFQNAIPSKRESFNIGELFIHPHPHNHPHNHKACRLAINSSQLACSRNLPMNDKCTMQILYSTNILHFTLIYEYLCMLYMPKTAVLDCCLAHTTSLDMKIVNIAVYLCLVSILRLLPLSPIANTHF